MLHTCNQCHSINFAQQQLEYGDDMIRNADHLMAEAIHTVAGPYKDVLLAKPSNYAYAFPDLLTFHDVPNRIFEVAFGSANCNDEISCEESAAKGRFLLDDSGPLCDLIEAVPYAEFVGPRHLCGFGRQSRNVKSALSCVMRSPSTAMILNAHAGSLSDDLRQHQNRSLLGTFLRQSEKYRVSGETKSRDMGWHCSHLLNQVSEEEGKRPAVRKPLVNFSIGHSHGVQRLCRCTIPLP